MKTVRHAGLLVAILVASGTETFATQIVRCEAKGAEDVVIALDAKRLDGRRVSCISGGFVVDMTPCAPNGAFGLSAPTGSASLVKIVDRWQDYANHMGAVAGHFVTDHQIHFSGGFNSPDSGYEEGWSFEANRLTGKATLKEKDKRPVTFTCSKADRKF